MCGMCRIPHRPSSRGEAPHEARAPLRRAVAPSSRAGRSRHSQRRVTRVPSANDRVGVGFIGSGLIGKRHALDFHAEPDVAAVAVAEVHRGSPDEATALIGGTIMAASFTSLTAYAGHRPRAAI